MRQQPNGTRAGVLCALACMSLMISLPKASQAGGLFAAPLSFDLESSAIGPTSIALGDLNGDGTRDLVVENHGSNTVSVFLGHGDGTFGPGREYATDWGPWSVTIGDLNADQRPDLVVANAGTVSILLGKGDGTFESKIDLDVRSHGFFAFAAIGDLNADGKPDLAVVGSAQLVSVLLGNGDGTFMPRTFYRTGDGVAFCVAIGDLNGDGKPDLAVANYGAGGNTVSVLVGNGDGTFQPQESHATGPAPSCVAIGDLNGDKKLDLVTSNVGDNTVSVLLGNGDGTFGSHTDYPAGPYPFSFAMGDVDGDGNLDAVTADQDSSVVSVLLGKGDGTLEPRTDYPAGGKPICVAIADLNSDRESDLATAAFTENGIIASILLHVGLSVSVTLDPQVINLKSKDPWVTAHIEPASFDPASIDIATLRLAGSVTVGSRAVVLEDYNANGLPDLMVKFSQSALRTLLTPGLNSLTVTGSLVTGQEFEGAAAVRVLQGGERHPAASVAPSPLNPTGTLSFTTAKPGNVTVMMFDLQGRLVRTLMEAANVPAGEHAVRIDGRGGQGEALPSGMYFFRVVSPDEALTGRFSILK